MTSASVIDVADLAVDYWTAINLKRVRAVRGISFAVERGEIFGFLGPNGAGKTTTIRVMMGLIRATAGSCKIFGHTIPSREARRRLGFLPESPYFYDYLNARELIDLAGRLCGVDRPTRRKRGEELIDLVGLGHAGDMPMRKYSKGMLQRAGIAQALISDPDLVVFDEPMSGLDPLGRKDMRDVILSLRDAGKTVFFSTHILPDVEMICDRVAIIVKGQVRQVGKLSDLVSSRIIGTEVVLRLPREKAKEAASALSERVGDMRRRDFEVDLTLADGADVDDLLELGRGLGAGVVSVTPKYQTLEEVFIRSAMEERDA